MLSTQRVPVLVDAADLYLWISDVGRKYMSLSESARTIPHVRFSVAAYHRARTDSILLKLELEDMSSESMEELRCWAELAGFSVADSEEWKRCTPDARELEKIRYSVDELRDDDSREICELAVRFQTTAKYGRGKATRNRFAVAGSIETAAQLPKGARGGPKWPRAGLTSAGYSTI